MWAAIVEQIRDCSVFAFALSDKSLKSKPCRAEVDYATALTLPVLPVQIGAVKSYRTDTLFSKQYVDYRDSTKNRIIDLVSVLRKLSGQRGELPVPLPEAPQIPYEYLQRLGAAIRGSADLGRSAQAAIVSELRSALDVEEDDTVRADIRELMQLLRDRTDVVYPIVKEIDSIS
jgi:serine/threonine kinase PknH